MNALADIASCKKEDKQIVFQHLFRHLAAYCNTTRLYASGGSSEVEFSKQIDHWANELLKNAWAACDESNKNDCPVLDQYSDTSLRGLPPLPAENLVDGLLNTILLLHITLSKGYSARTRVFLSSLGTLNEGSIVSTLKDPDAVVQEAQKQAERVKEQEAKSSKPWKMAGMGLGAVAGGVLIGITGGLAAPIVGASVSTLLGIFGLGGTAAGLLATGLASSSVVCAGLFGAYGANKTATMIERHTREVRDLALLPVRPPRETLAVRLCISGWINTREDITAPWKVFDQTEDTFALQWEVEALQNLSAALYALLKAQAMKYVKAEIIKRTFLAGLMASLAPLAYLQIGKIIDNPWANTRALSIKTGRVLGILLASNLLGARPISLTGYSLGSLVIFEALKYLSTLPPSETIHLIADVYLFGLPAPSEDIEAWRAIRRVVSGKLVNGYVDPEEDYVLAILSRASSVTSGRWGVSGLEPVSVQGVDNVKCDGVVGHLEWVGKVGLALERCGAKGVDHEEVEKQLKNVAAPMDEYLEMQDKEVDQISKEGPVKPLKDQKEGLA